MSLVPSDSEVIRDAIDARLLDVWTATMGRVQAYDAAKQVAEILPVVRRPLLSADGEVEHEDLPVLPNVPVWHRRSGGFSEHVPVKKGDTGLIVFTTDSFQMWRDSGGVVNPGDLRRHSLTNAVFVPGFVPAANALTDTPDDEVVFGGGVYRVGDDTAGFVALATLVSAQLDALKTAISSAAATEADAAGLGGMTALKAALTTGAWPGAVAASKLKSK